ncbi:MAG: hypothetical protein ACRBG0_19270 [Lewinella sp.]|uniref:hypothetical protein n=1 Tax=Lewinella sp. TaxID=2004506 RepID=UPI003D6BC616
MIEPKTKVSEKKPTEAGVLRAFEVKQILLDVEDYGAIELSDSGTENVEMPLSGCMEGYRLVYMLCYTVRYRSSNCATYESPFEEYEVEEVKYNLEHLAVVDGEGEALTMRDHHESKIEKSILENIEVR